jgi:hypothetical protein
MSYRVRNPDLHQEEDTVSPGPILLAGLLVVVISAVMIGWALREVASSKAALRPSGVFPEQWLGPRRTVQNVRQDIFGERPTEALDVTARRDLGSYGYVDERAGIIHIPIDLAIDLVVAGRKP